MLRAQTVYAVGGYAVPDFASPDPIGSSTPNSGIFTTLVATGYINYRGGDNASDTNSGYGVGALDSNAGGLSNTAFGQNALTANTAGNYNTAFGTEAAKSAVGVLDSITAFGTWALRLTTVGTLTGIGAFALSKNTTGTRNTAVGNVSMLECTSGTDNVAVGDSAGATLTDGIRNTMLGSGADVTSASVQNAIALGYGVTAGQNQTAIGNSNTTETILRGQVKGGAGTGTGQPVMVGTLSVNSTPVGNVGAGTDDLMTYPLPADSLSANNKGIRVAAWGTTAANANAKTLTFAFGGTTVLSKSIALGAVAIQWRVEATILRAASGAQVISALFYYGESPNSCTPFLFSASPTENEAVAITIKCTGAATADNDIVQRGMIVEFIN